MPGALRIRWAACSEKRHFGFCAGASVCCWHCRAAESTRGSQAVCKGILCGQYSLGALCAAQNMERMDVRCPTALFVTMELLKKREGS